MFGPADISIQQQYARALASPLRLSPCPACLLVSCWAACTIVKLMHGKGCLASKAAAHFSVRVAGWLVSGFKRVLLACGYATSAGVQRDSGLSCKDKATSCLSCRLVGSSPRQCGSWLTAPRCTQMGRGQAKLFVLRRGLMAGSRCQGRLVQRLDDLCLSRLMAVVCNDTLCDGGNSRRRSKNHEVAMAGQKFLHVPAFGREDQRKDWAGLIEWSEF